MNINWEKAGLVIRSENRQNVLILLEVPLTPSHVAKKLEISLTHASKIIRELEKQRLVECLNDKTKRGRIYKRTKEGDEIIGYVQKIDKL